MNPYPKRFFQFAILGGVFLIIWLLFPAAFAFVEMAAREIRYLWWVVLLVALGTWLIWGSRAR